MLEWGQSHFPYLKWKGNSNVSKWKLCNLPGILISKLTMFEHLHLITAVIMHIPFFYQLLALPTSQKWNMGNSNVKNTMQLWTLIKFQHYQIMLNWHVDDSVPYFHIWYCSAEKLFSSERKIGNEVVEFNWKTDKNNQWLSGFWYRKKGGNAFLSLETAAN